MAAASGVEYLRTFPDFEQGNVSASEALGLTRVLALLEELGSPHLRLPVAHVAGTKGKGSTSASLASIAAAAGYRTGLFTQPHLLRINERFSVNGKLLDDVTLSEIALGQIQPAVDRLALRGITGIQQFEAQVALAMLWFEALHVDLVVLEVGLGGRLDATNVVPRPLVTILTSIGFDHTAILGSTLPLIAAEKAAIVKPRVPAVASPQSDEVVSVFEDRCRLMEAPLLLGDRDWRLPSVSTGLTGTDFDLEIGGADAQHSKRFAALLGDAGHSPVARRWRLSGLRTPLRGVYQAWNAAAATVAALVIATRLTRIDEQAIRIGLAATAWPGRLQTISAEPTVVVDGAHTPESATVLAAAITELYPGRRIALVCGIQADKDIPGIAAPLARLAAVVVATAAHHRRAADPTVIARAFRDAGHREVSEETEPMGALAWAKEATGIAGVVLVTGSLYLVGEILAGTATDPWAAISET